MKFRAGDQVEVRGKDDILRTLDKSGTLDGLPFMPQMFKYCGQKFEVFKRAHKTCDTVNRTGGRKITDCVHLNVRCDGETHGDCQAACLIFWKTAWLKPAQIESLEATSHPANTYDIRTLSDEYCCSEKDVAAATRVGLDNTERFVCQATQLPYFTTLLPWYDVRQYIEDYTSGNATLNRITSGLLYASYYGLCRALRKTRGGFTLLRIYDLFQSVRRGVPYPRWTGLIPAGDPTPTRTLDLQPGELVRVRPYKEILETLDTQNKNRGLYFDAEMVPYCGGIYQVSKRVHNFIDEKSGKTVIMKTPAIILDNVWCQARYSDCRMFCPRSIYSWWREIWLERVAVDSGSYLQSDREL
jgi:hypothetical protein